MQLLSNFPLSLSRPPPSQVLEVQPTARPNAISRAAEARVAAAPAEYSELAVKARGEILSAAAACLIDSEARTQYDTSLLQEAGRLADIPWNKLPGALALLQVRREGRENGNNARRIQRPPPPRARAFRRPFPSPLFPPP